MNTTTITKATSQRHALPTSRQSGPQQRGVFAILRDLMPKRPLTSGEARFLAELQATHLLRLAGITGPPTPTALIEQLPRVQVVYDPDLPCEGSAIWVSGRWLILINGSDPQTRQRFTLAHELRHCLDHPYRDRLYPDPASTIAEQSAHAFAAALLMPKIWLRRAWTAGHQQVSDLAAMFNVSPEAMARRLDDLGLRERPISIHQRYSPRPTRETVLPPRREYEAAA